MTKENLYILDNWDKYNLFRTKSDCYDFLVCCEAYDTSLEVVKESPIDAYDSFDFVYLHNEITPQRVVNAILEYTEVFRSSTLEDIADWKARQLIDDGIYDEDDYPELYSDLLESRLDIKLIKVNDDIVLRYYC